MAYLIAHIAVYLLIAQLLGLLLGWLLWGYAARQRALNVQDLQEQIVDLQLAIQQPPQIAPALEPPPAAPASALIEGDLPVAESYVSAFLELPAGDTNLTGKSSKVSPDLEAEVRESRIEYLEKQVRELEGIRDRLPLLQADLSDAIAGRRAAELKSQEAKADFEVRSSNLLIQIRDFEKAAQAWDTARSEFERTAIANERELAIVKANLRDLQNSQRPPLVDSPDASRPGLVSNAELDELRHRCDELTHHRDSLAAELERRNSEQSATSPVDHPAQLEQALQAKDLVIHQQVGRIESLLWRVAELEPFADTAARLDDELRRQQAELAAHLDIRTEHAEQIRVLRHQVERLEADLHDLTTAHSRSLRSVQQDLESATLHARELEKTIQHRNSLLSHLAVLEEQNASLLIQAASLQEEAQKQLQFLNEKHQAEITRLKVSSALRIRRLRQNITSFKA